MLQKCFSFTVIGWQMPAEFQFRMSTRSVPFASVVGTIRHHTTRRPLGLLLWLGHFLAHQLINQSSSVIHVNRSNLANFYGACQNSRRIFASIPILTLIRHQALSCYGQFMPSLSVRLSVPDWQSPIEMENVLKSLVLIIPSVWRNLYFNFYLLLHNYYVLYRSCPG